MTTAPASFQEVPQTILDKCAANSRVRSVYNSILRRALHHLEHGAGRFDTLLIERLEHVAKPERVLVDLDRFLESSFSPSAVIDDFLRHPALLDTFFRLVSASRYISDILIRDPGIFRWIASGDAVARLRTREEFLTQAREISARFQTSERRITAVKRFHRREMLRIAARDILTRAPLETTVLELSWLADAIIETTLAEAITLVESRYGVEFTTRIAIIALGKLGGEELNYSSDVDLMAVYENNHTVRPSLSTQDMAVRIVETLIHLLSGHTRDGSFYRTDFRLRPDGNAGALAITFSGLMNYYETRGALWERQMLLKARPVAGDPEFGFAVVEGLARYSFPRVRLLPASRLLADIHRRVSSRWAETRNVKHCRGGIRHIEFCVQALQLLYGSSDAPYGSSLRLRGTLPAIDRLVDMGHLAAGEAAVLRNGYVYFRSVEHALQLLRFEQTHELPKGNGEIPDWSVTLELRDTNEVESRMTEFCEAVGSICDSILSTDTSIASDDVLYTEETFRAMGFKKLTLAATTTSALIEGRPDRPHGALDRQRMRSLLPHVISAIAGELFPDNCLASLEMFLSQWTSWEAAETLLSEPSSRSFLIRMASLAPSQLRKIAARSIFAEAVSDAPVAPGTSAEDATRMKLIRETNLMGRYLLGSIRIEEFCRSLSDLADDVLAHAVRRFMPHGNDAQFEIVALGKYGGRELSPGSDLDVVFLFEETPGFTAEDAQDCAMRCIEYLREKDGIPLYCVDARLRPEGRSSPLATSFEEYRHYIGSRASIWEKQSLLKARVVLHAPGMQSRVDTLLAEALDKAGKEYNVLEEITSMRSRMEPVNHRRLKTFFDVKLSPGGLVDAEFAVQLVQLMKGIAHPEIYEKNTFRALRIIPEALPALAEPFTALRSVYEEWRILLVWIRLLFDSPANALPADATTLEMLAAAMGEKSVADFLQSLEARQREMRDAYTAVCFWLASSG